MNLHAILITFLAASASLIGGLIPLFFKKSEKIMAFSLSFSAGMMIYLSFVEILPESFSLFNGSKYIPFLFFLLGIALIVIVDKMTESYGHEDHKVEDNLKKIGLLSFLMITLHNFPEGMAVYSIALNEENLSFPIMIAFGIHNIPEGLIIAAPIYFSSGSKLKAIYFVLISVIVEIIGGVLGYHSFSYFFNKNTNSLILAFVSGIMIFLSIDQILPEARKIWNHHIVSYGFILGIVLMGLILI